jgi:hypothetical protein
MKKHSAFTRKQSPHNTFDLISEALQIKNGSAFSKAAMPRGPEGVPMPPPHLAPMPP